MTQSLSNTSPQPDTPLVSVIIAVYNGEKWITETLASVLNQTYDNLEIILIDDGSTDNTVKVIEKSISQKIKLIQQQNQGQSTAFNRALQEAQGDYIQYLDADDLIASNKIETQLAFLQTQPKGSISCCEWTRFHQDHTAVSFTPQALWQDFLPVDWLLCAWQNHLMMHGATWLIPRTIIDKAGPWNPNLTLINDFEYFSRVILASTGVKFCWGAKTYYRSGLENSVSGLKTDNAWQSAFLSLTQGTQNLLSFDNNALTRQVCANVFQRFIYEVYPAVPELRKQAQQQVKILGGSTEKPMGGPLFKILNRFLGWQTAKTLKEWLYRNGYERWRNLSAQST